MTDRLTISALADYLGVTQSTIRSYLTRDWMPQPSPCPCCNSKTWARADIDRWVAARPGRTGRPKKA